MSSHPLQGGREHPHFTDENTEARAQANCGEGSGQGPGPRPVDVAVLCGFSASSPVSGVPSGCVALHPPDPCP